MNIEFIQWCDQLSDFFNQYEFCYGYSTMIKRKDNHLPINGHDFFRNHE